MLHQMILPSDSFAPWHALLILAQLLPHLTTSSHTGAPEPMTLQRDLCCLQSGLQCYISGLTARLEMMTAFFRQTHER